MKYCLNRIAIIVLAVMPSIVMFAEKGKNKRQGHYHSGEHIMRRSAQSMSRAVQPMARVTKEAKVKPTYSGKKDHQRYHDRSL